MIYLVGLFGFLFAMFRELSEHAKENGFKGYPNWWNTGKSWTNKDTFGERFLPWLPPKFSSWLFHSPLVWVTDAEHFFQLFSLIAVLSALLTSDSSLVSVGVFYIGNALAGAIKPILGLR